MKRFLLAGALILAAAASPRADDFSASIGGWKKIIPKFQTQAKPAGTPAIKNPVPFLRYLTASWTCEDAVVAGPSHTMRIGTARTTLKCTMAASQWRQDAENACHGRCRKVKEPNGFILLKCGVNDFSVSQPCS